MGYGPENAETETKKIVTPTAKHRLGDVIKYYDEKRKGIHHFGEVIAIIITKTHVEYQTQDHQRVKEENIKASFYESPF